MTFAGMEDTAATYFDKLAYKEALMERYGLNKGGGKANGKAA